MLKQLRELKRQYDYDCMMLRRELQATHPGLLSARLQMRGDQYDSDVDSILKEMQHGRPETKNRQPA